LPRLRHLNAQEHPHAYQPRITFIEASDMKRFECPELRFDLSEWARSPGPNGKRYWRWDAGMGCVVLHLQAPAFEVDMIEADEIGIPRIVRKRVDGSYVQKWVSRAELLNLKAGWRACIARHLRGMRRFLRQYPRG
jgi:hypothetical protein